MIKIKTLIAVASFLVCNQLAAQTIPVNRVYDWKHSGLIEPLPAYTTTLNMQTAGADVTGVIPSDNIYLSVISQCTVTNQSYTIFFPTGIYTFTNTINLKDNVKLEGVGANTHLIFKTAATCVNLQGTINTTTTYSITQTANRYDRFLKSSANTPTAVINVNDFIAVKQHAATLVNNDWAYNSVGQFFKITAVNADTLKLNHELRKDYALIDTISIYKVSPIQNAGLKCMHITRSNSSVDQIATVQMSYAYNCFAEGIEVDSCFFSHITLDQSFNCQISGSYFHDAYDYGGGGRGYGINIQMGSCDNKIENNIFDHLRHSVLCQAGVNGNVTDYNYSINAYWTSFPTNAAGDLVLHGNYVFANLFEGNICQQIVVDNSHGINGPDNNFFRNRAQNYGIYMNSAQPSNGQVYVGNEITNISIGQYIMAGTGHFEYGNKKQGTITPAGTTSLTEVSYCFTTQPGFLAGNNWPVIGIPNTYNTGTIPAEVRNGSGSKLSCNALTTNVTAYVESNTFQIYPNPGNQFIHIKTAATNFDGIDVVNLLGELVLHSAAVETINVSALPNGVYTILIKSGQKLMHTEKVFIVR